MSPPLCSSSFGISTAESKLHSHKQCIYIYTCTQLNLSNSTTNKTNNTKFKEEQELNPAVPELSAMASSDPNHAVEDFDPPSDLVSEEACDTLLLYLPGRHYN